MKDHAQMIANTAKKILYRLYPPRHLGFFLQRMVMRPSARAWMARMAARRLPRPNVVDPGRLANEVQILARRGYVMLPNLATTKEIAEMREWLRSKPVFDRWKSSAGTFDAGIPPADCHTAPYHDADVVNSPHALKWANNPDVLAIVSQLLGAKPTLSNLTVWWSYPGHTAPQEAESFHRDVDDLHFIKLFIYLTDVDGGCGPHAFVPGSQIDGRLAKIRRYQDEDVRTIYGEDSIKHFIGEKGTSFLENTFGLHKGQLPSHSRRLLFQAQYSLHPIGIYSYSPVTRDVKADLDPYINRLYVK